MCMCMFALMAQGGCKDSAIFLPVEMMGLGLIGEVLRGGVDFIDLCSGGQGEGGGGVRR